jgi:hypothetical protein
MTFGIRTSSTIRQISLTLLLAVMVLGVGCVRISQDDQPSTLKIELVEPLFPPAAGKDTLNIRLFDMENQSVNDATITVKGDMTHAGMIPILAETSGGDNGLYQLPIEWPMGGDWVLTVQVALPDGTLAEEIFPLTISSDPADCSDEATETP